MDFTAVIFYFIVSFSMTVFPCKEKNQEFGYKCCANYFWNASEENCSLCLPGFIGFNCSLECPSGHYGSECQKKCPNICSQCDKVDGKCDGMMQTNLTDQSTTPSIMNTENLPATQTKSKREALYIITTIGTSAVLALVVILLKSIYEIAKQSPVQTLLLQIQDPETEAAQNSVNPAFDPIYDSPC